jgi:hypothetical protein
MAQTFLFGLYDSVGFSQPGLSRKAQVRLQLLLGKL